MFKQLIVLLSVLILIQSHSFSENSKVKQLDSSNFVQETGVGSGSIQKPSIGMFYAPWCGHCKKLIPTFEELAQATDQVTVFAVDCTVERAICDQFDLKGYPTIYYFSNNYQAHKFKGPRQLENFLKFVDSEYKNAETMDIKFDINKSASSDSFINKLGGPIVVITVSIFIVGLILLVFLLFCTGSSSQPQQYKKFDSNQSGEGTTAGDDNQTPNVGRSKSKRE